MIYYPQKESVQSRDLFKFWETSDNISLTEHDRYIVALKD